MGGEYFGLLMILIVVILWPTIGVHYERKAWNKGQCNICTFPWEKFDVDSHGGRGYTCSNCNNNVWISYPLIDRNYRRN